MAKAISLAVFGDGGAAFGSGESIAERLTPYLGAFVRAHHALFPGWLLYIHHDENVLSWPYAKALLRLQHKGFVNLVQMPTRPKEGKCEKMLWRFAPVWNRSLEWVFSRDLDALPTWRERRCVEEFMKSGAVLHTIHDNMQHAGIMGGLSGASVPKLRDALGIDSFEAFTKRAGYSDAQWATHGADQNYLNTKVAPKVSVFEHSVFSPGRAGSTIMLSKVVQKIAPFDDSLVSEIVKEQSDSLIPFMGTAGYNHEAAVAFYDEHGGALMKHIRDAERGA